MIQRLLRSIIFHRIFSGVAGCCRPARRAECRFFKNTNPVTERYLCIAFRKRIFNYPYDKIEQFLTNQVTITASALTGNINATVFPMPPMFGVSASLNNVSKCNATFNQYSFADTDYLQSLSDYFDQLAVQVQKEMGDNAPMMLGKRCAGCIGCR